MAERAGGQQTRRDLARCNRELAAVEAELRAGNLDVAGGLLGIADWSAEKELIEKERKRMYQPYEDILSRLGEPKWWDENGVPRYEDFEPALCADIYAVFAALLEITCQGCGRPLPVSAAWSVCEDALWDKDGKNPLPVEGLPDKEGSGCFGYGDAPWHTHESGGQCSGTTMSTGVTAVLQFWERASTDWERKPVYEHRYPLEVEP